MGKPLPVKVGESLPFSCYFSQWDIFLGLAGALGFSGINIGIRISNVNFPEVAVHPIRLVLAQQTGFHGLVQGFVVCIQHCLLDLPIAQTLRLGDLPGCFAVIDAVLESGSISSFPCK